MSDVEVSLPIDADPHEVWRMVSDVTRMGEWSPETRSCRWLGAATGPEVGARFRGWNRFRWLRWSTTCTVTATDPGRRFAFDVHYGPVAISTWVYDVAARDGGCDVTEAWTDRRPLWLKVGAVPAMGVVDRPAHNRRGMQRTLAALKTVAESR